MMKKIKLAGIAVVALVALVSCKKDKDDKNLVDSYSPKLNEASGTSYKATDYFPMKDSLRWTYDYSGTSVGSETESYNGEKDSDSWDDDFEGVREDYTDAPETITVGSKDYEAIPFISDEDADMDDYSDYSKNFYFLMDGDIYTVDAYAGYYKSGYTFNSEDVELFLESDLVVGDNYELDIEEIAGGDVSDYYDNVSVSGKAKYFVLGMTKMEINGEKVDVLQLDAVMDVTLSVSTKTSEGSISGSSTVRGNISMYLQKNVGEVAQDVELTSSSKMTMSAGGQSASYTYNDVMEYGYEMTSFQDDYNGYGWKSASKEVEEELAEPIEQLNKIAIKMVQNIW